MTSLESLPTVLIYKVFSHLDTLDLLSVCLVSKLFYYAAALLLYHDVVVVEDKMLLEFIRNIWAHLGPHFCVVIGDSAFQKLTLSLRNRSLAGFVTLLIILSGLARHEVYSEKLKPLRDTLKLRHFVSPGTSLSLVSCLNPSNLVRLAMTIKQDSRVEFNLDLPNLQHLKIYYENQESNKHQFVRLAHSLRTSGIIDRLVSLEFEELVVKDLKLLNETNNNLKMATWLDFFYELASFGSQYNLLRRLMLDGFINDQGPALCDALDTIFDLSELNTLRLAIKEFSHLNNIHFSNTRNLLVPMSIRCVNLRKLTILPTFNCLTCQLEMLSGALSQLSQLQVLNLRFEVLNFEHTRTIYKIVSTIQVGLRQLLLYDKAREFVNEKELMQYLKSGYSQFEKNSFYLQLFEKSYPVEMDPSRWKSVLRNLYGDFYKRNQTGLSTYLKRYFDTAGFKKPPRVEVLTINNIHLEEYSGQLCFVDRDHTPVVGIK